MKLSALVGSGDKIGMFILPFLIIGIVLDLIYPALFHISDVPALFIIIALAILFVGLVIWIWAVILILKKVPKGELIVNGPYSIVKHPLYTGVSLLVLPWLGLILNSWLGLFFGLILYIGSRIYAPNEEKLLSATFGKEWDKYCKKVKIPWL